MIKKVLLVLVAGALVTAGGLALALPATTPDAGILGTNGKVRALLQAGPVMWVGGRFTETVGQTANETQGGLSNIVGLDVQTGQRAASVVTQPQLTGSGSIVYDLSLSPDRLTVYAAGTFSAANGAKNLVAFDAATGALVQSFEQPPSLRSVLFDSGRVLGGGTKLQAWLPTGAKDETWDVTTVSIDPDIRTHVTNPAYRDLKPVVGGGYFAACQCDWLTDAGTTYRTKALVRLTADGSYDPTWTPGGSDPLSADSGAFGIDAFVDVDGVVLAAGGSDFVEKFNLTTGQKMWKTNTNGSAQTVTDYTDPAGSNYFVGGHYRCLSDTAGSNENAYFHPRLSALGLNGVLDKSWTVPITPIYNGVWVVVQDGFGRLWVGGEFKKVGGQWDPATQDCANTRPTATGQTNSNFLARFSGAI